MKLKQHSNGRYYAHLSGGQAISLKTRNRDEAKKLARDAKMEELERAAKVNALTAETVTRVLAGRKVSGADAFAEWKTWAGTVGLTPNTMQRYETYILAFLRSAGFEQRSVAAIRSEDVDAFVNDPGRITANTRRNRLYALSSFFTVCTAKGFAPLDPSALVRVKLDGLTFEQKEPRRREPFTDAELKLLRGIEDPFWRTFVLLGEHYGFRISDVAQLEWASFAKPGVIIVHTDKRDRRLELPLDPRVKAHIDALPRHDEVYVFPDQRLTITTPTLRSKLSTYFGRELGRLGIKGKNTHCLRHMFATKRAGLGDTVDQIRIKMGHESVETTKGYVHA